MDPQKALLHVGHRIFIATYGTPSAPVNVAVECEDCNEVVVDADVDPSLPLPSPLPLPPWRQECSCGFPIVQTDDGSWEHDAAPSVWGDDHAAEPV